MLKRVFGAGILIALLAFVIGCASQKSQLVAKVNGKPITHSQLCKELEQSDRGRALDALIVRQLIQQEASKKGVKVTEEEIEARIAGLKDVILAGTGKDLIAWLQDQGQTEQEFKTGISRQILTAKLILPKEDREKFFNEKKKDLRQLPYNNEAVIYRQIVVSSKEDAEAIRKELTEGAKEGKAADFAKAAEQRSLDPMTNIRGGMVGWAVKGKLTPPDPELEKALFSLKPGEISEPLIMKTPATAPSVAGAPSKTTGPQRWRIVKVEKYFPPHEITLAGNEDVIEEAMLNSPTYQMQLQQYFDRLRADANVEIVSPRYKAVGDAYKQRREARARQTASPSSMAGQQAPGGMQGPAMPEGRPH